MNKANIWIWSFVLAIYLGFGIWSLGFWLGGCASSQQEIVTTTTSTTTTSPSTSTSSTAPTTSTITTTSTTTTTIIYTRGNAITVDSSGNVYIVGITNENLGAPPAGWDDIFLAKYDQSGVRQWVKQKGTPGQDWPNAVATDSSGNVFIAGSTNGSLDGKTNAGGGDIFLMKYNSAGDWQWTKLRGTSGNDYARGIAVDPSGNIYLSGTAASGLDGNPNTGAWGNLFLMKYNSAGGWQWTKELGTTGGPFVGGYGVVVDASGEVYVSGATDGNIFGTSLGGVDYLLVKYGSDGKLLWGTQEGTSAGEEPFGMAIDKSSGSVYLAGYTSYTGLYGSEDIFLVKYDLSGNRLWSKELGTDTSDIAFAAAVGESGNIYIAGYTNGNLGGTNSGPPDLFLAKFTPASGEVEWIRQLGTAEFDLSTGVAYDPVSGLIYMTGLTEGGLDGADPAHGDYFLVKYNTSGVKQ